MHHLLLSAVIGTVLASGSVAAKTEYPDSFTTRDMAVNGAVLHVRTAGHGPAVLLIHGFGDTGDMWVPIAIDLARDHTVVIPDLRGMGLSDHPAGGYDKKSQARDLANVLDQLHVTTVDVVGHDIGNMVSYAFAAQYPARVRKLVLMDAPVPGLGAAWDWLKANPSTWHFHFYGPDEERLVAGRERIYLDRFYNEMAAHPEKIDEATRAHYAKLYARPGAMHSAFAQFAAFGQDEQDNQVLAAKGKLAMPVLAIGGDHSMGVKMAESAQVFASDVHGVVVADAGHWLMEEQPAKVTALISDFLRRPPVPGS